MPYTNEGKRPAVEVLIEEIERIVDGMITLMGIEENVHFAQRNMLQELILILDRVEIPLEQVTWARNELVRIFSKVLPFRRGYNEILKLFGDFERFDLPDS